MSTYKLDIFEVLDRVDHRDFSYYERLSSEEQKAFIPAVTLRWMSGTSNSDTSEISLLILNEIANTNFFDLYQHPELQYRLLASAGLGAAMRHSWIPLPKSTTKKSKVHEFMGNQYSANNDFEIDLIVSKHTKQSFNDFVTACGVEPKEAKELQKAFNDLTKQEKHKTPM